MTNQYGLVTWDSVEFSKKSSSNRRSDDFIRLQGGSNVLRLVTRPFQYNFHKFKADPNDKSDYGVKIKCSMPNGSCPLCDLPDDNPGKRVHQRWYIGVIDRRTQSYKILDMSSTVFQAVKGLTQKDKWGDPGNYDIDIVVDKNAGVTGYYSVYPEPKEPLSDQDIEIRKTQVNKELLLKLCEPFTPERALEKMTKAREKAGVAAPVGHVAPAADPTTTSPAPVAEESSSNSDDDDDDIYDFTAVSV